MLTTFGDIPLVLDWADWTPKSLRVGSVTPVPVIPVIEPTGILPFPVEAISQDEFLVLMDRLLPSHYLDPLKTTGPGYELLQGDALMFARISSAVARLGGDSQIATARAGASAYGTVWLYRASTPSSGTEIAGQSGASASVEAGAPVRQMRVTGLTGMTSDSVGRYLYLTNASALPNDGLFPILNYVDAETVDVLNPAGVIPDSNNGNLVWNEQSLTVIVKSGTIVGTSVGGRNFRTLHDITFFASDLGPIPVVIQAVAPGYEYNVQGQVIAADTEVLAGEIDTVVQLNEEPPLGDTTIQVKQLLPTTGGRDAALDALGQDRGILRLSGESDDKYRARVRVLPDTVSFDAINRAVDSLLRPTGATFDVIETYDGSYQTCWDAPPGGIVGSSFNSNLFTYDDPDDARDPFRNRWLGESDYRGGIVVVVGNIQPLADTSMAWDDSAMSMTDLVSSASGGRRAACAFDVSNTFNLGQVGGFDGSDLPRAAVYKGLHDTLQSIKAGGVSAAVELLGQ